MKPLTKETLLNETKLSIRLMGEPQVYFGGNELVQFKYRKSVALLAYLAETNKAYSREYLADLLWRNLPEKNAQGGLRKILSEINKVLPQLLSNENHKIALSDSFNIEVDSLAFEEIVSALRKKPVGEISETQIMQLENLQSLCAKPFMNGFLIQKSPAFEDWMLNERNYLQRLGTEALIILGDYAYGVGHHQRAMDYARQLLEIEPAQEEAHFNLMSLFALNGQRTLALKQYEICKQALKDVYGSTPKQNMLDLYDRIRSEKESQSSNRRLPVPTMPIYGREEDMERVLARLQEEQCRILTVIGPGGIGKTHLSLMVGNEINLHFRDQFKDGVIFVALQALNSIHSLSSSIAHQLGYTYERDSDPVDQLCDFLAPYRMVLILDNFEQLVMSLAEFQSEQYDLINRIMQAAPGVKLLITSRIRLNFQGEYIYPLKGISFPIAQEEEIDLIRKYPAVSLFIQRAKQLSGFYNPDEAELQGIIDICRSVNGVPLGILLAAGWANLLNAREIAASIKSGDGKKGVAFLATGGQDMPERHRDMDSVFRQSWNMISEKQRETLAALSFLSSSFPVEAAREIALADLTDLKVLLDHSLLERKHAGRLQMHELLRQYAASQNGNQSAVYKRTCRYYAAKVSGWEQAIKGPGQQQAIQEMNEEIDNLRSLWDHIIASADFVTAAKMFEGTCMYYTWRRYYGEAANFCRNIENKLEEKQVYDESFSKVDAQRLLARVLTWHASFIKLDEADAYLLRSLQILDDDLLAECDTRSERAFTCYWLAANYSQTGKFGEGMKLHEQSKTLYESLQDDWHIKDLYLFSGIMYWDKSRYAEGKKMLEECLAISRRLGDRRGVAHALLWLGNTLLFMGDQSGEKMIRESLSILSELGGKMGARTGVIQACSALFILGMFEEACGLMRNYDKQDAYDSRKDSANIIFAISLIHTGNYEEAREYVENGVAFARELGEAHGENLALITQAWLAIYEKDFDGAEKILLESLQNSKEQGVKELESWSSATLALISMLMGKSEDTIVYLRNTFEIANSINSIAGKLFALGCMSLWLCLNGKAQTGYAIYLYAWQYPLMRNSVWWMDHAGVQIEEIAEGLSGDEVKAAKDQFAEMGLDEVISDVLDGLHSPVQGDPCGIL